MAANLQWVLNDMAATGASGDSHKLKGRQVKMARQEASKATHIAGTESFPLTDVVPFGGEHRHPQSSAAMSADEDDLEFGWQRSLPTSHHKFQSRQKAFVQGITSEQERVNAELWGESRNRQLQKLHGAKHYRCGEFRNSGENGSESGVEKGEQFAWWTPELPRETQATLSSGSVVHQSEEQIEREINMKRRWGAVSGQAKKIAEAKRKEENLAVASKKTKGFILYSKCSTHIDNMKNALERYEDLTTSARYQNIQRVLKDPDQAIAPLLNLCDFDCTEKFTLLQDQLQPMAYEAKRHITHDAQELRKDEDESSIQEIFLKQSQQTHQEMQAVTKTKLSLEAGTLESAVKACLEEFTETTQSIHSLKKEHKHRQQVYQAHCDEMDELERRETHISSIIYEVEGRARDIEALKKEKLKKLQQDVFGVKRQLEGMETCCKIELHKIKAVFGTIENKLMDSMLKNVPNMLQLRIKRQKQELNFQEQSMACRKEQLKRICRKLKKAISQAMVRLHDALEVNQVMELRHCQIEGEALHMELELRSRELIEANGIPGLHINQDVEDGLLPLLQRELQIQLHWFAQRSHHFVLDHNTLNLTKKPNLTTPLILLTCTRALLQSWEKEQQASTNVVEVTGLSSYDASSPCIMDDANEAKVQVKPLKGRLRGRLAKQLSAISSQSSNWSNDAESVVFDTSNSAANAAGVEVGLDGSFPTQDLEIEVSSPTQDLPEGDLPGLGVKRKVLPGFKVDGFLALSGPESGISYEPILGLDTSAAPEDSEKQQEAHDAARKAFKTNAADMFMEAILMRPNSNATFRHHFLKELRFLPVTGSVIDQLAEWWDEMQKTLAGLPSIATLQPSMKKCMADLQSARRVADACSCWITERAKIAGIFSDVLVMDLVWLCRFCDRIAERAGLLRGIVTVLEEASEKAAKQDRVAGAATKLLLMSKPLMNQAMLKSAEAWMLRIARVLHDQHCAKMACHSSLRWYCGKFYGNGQADLGAIVRGVEMMDRMYNAPQLQQSPAAKRLFAGEVDAEIRAALVQVLKNPEDFESALLVFDVITTCSAEDAVGAAFGPVGDDSSSAASDINFESRFSTVSVISDHLGTTDLYSPRVSHRVSATGATSPTGIDEAARDSEQRDSETKGSPPISEYGDDEEGQRMSAKRSHGSQPSRRTSKSSVRGLSIRAGEDQGLFEDGDIRHTTDRSEAQGGTQELSIALGLPADARDSDSEPESATSGELAEEEQRNHRRCALRAELSKIDKDVLRHRAIALGISDADLKRIDSKSLSVDSKAAASALIPIIVAAAIPLVSNTSEHRRNALKAELGEEDKDTLRERAIALGVSDVELKRIDNADDKAAASALIALIVAASIPLHSNSTKHRRCALRAELTEMDKDTLRERAIALGVSDVELKLIDNAADKAATSVLIELIVGASVPLHSNSTKHRRNALHAELTEMDKDTLRERALALGVRTMDLNLIDEDDKDAASALIKLIVARSMESPPAPRLSRKSMTPSGGPADGELTEDCLSEIPPLGSRLRSPDADQVIMSIIEGRASSASPPEGERLSLEDVEHLQDVLRGDLCMMEADTLRKEAIALGINETDLHRIMERIDDGDDTTDALINLIVAAAYPVYDGSPARATKYNVGEIVRVQEIGAQLLRQLERNAAHYAERRNTRKLARSIIDDVLSHVAYAPDLENEEISPPQSPTEHGRKSQVSFTQAGLSKEGHLDAKGRLELQAAAAYSRLSANWKLMQNTSKAIKKFHKRNAWAGVKASLRQNSGSEGGRRHSGENEDATDDATDDVEDVGEIVGQKKERVDRRKSLSHGSELPSVEEDGHQDEEIGGQIGVTSEEEPEMEHPMVDPALFLKQLKCLKNWFRLLFPDPKDKGKWIGFALKQKLVEARQTLKSLKKLEEVGSLSKPGIKEFQEDPLLKEDPVLVYGMKLLEEQNQQKFLAYFENLEAMIRQRADPRVTQSFMAAYNNEMLHVMMTQDDVDSWKGKELGTTHDKFNRLSPGIDITTHLPCLTNSSQVQNSLRDRNSLQDSSKHNSTADKAQVSFGNFTTPLFETFEPFHIKRKPESREKDAWVKLAPMSDKEVSVQDAIASSWSAPIAEKLTSSVEDWVERCAKSAQCSAPWLQKMRAEHTATPSTAPSTPGVSAERPLVKATDIARLPGLKTCLFESASSDRQHKRAGAAGPGKKPKTPRIAHVDSVVPSLIPVSAMLPISSLEVSTVLTSGQLRGAPSSKIASLGRDAVASGDAMMLGSVLNAKPSLARRLNQPLVGVEHAKYMPQNKPHSARQPHRRRQLYELTQPIARGSIM